MVEVVSIAPNTYGRQIVDAYAENFRRLQAVGETPDLNKLSAIIGDEYPLDGTGLRPDISLISQSKRASIGTMAIEAVLTHNWRQRKQYESLNELQALLRTVGGRVAIVSPLPNAPEDAISVRTISADGMRYKYNSQEDQPWGIINRDPMAIISIMTTMTQSRYLELKRPKRRFHAREEVRVAVLDANGEPQVKLIIED